MVQSGVLAVELGRFVEYLARRDRSSYTLRTYRLGLEDFGRWLDDNRIGLAAVTVRDVEAYAAQFAAGEGRRHRRAAVVELATGRPVACSSGRAPRTVNHRLSVLASFFSYLIERDTAAGSGQWAGRVSPVPMRSRGGEHGMPGGGDAPPRRARAELRMREPRRLPRELDPRVVQRLIDGAISWRDRALLLLLSRTGQRIGDWSEQHGRHGVLGMRLADVDRRSGTITVLLKGARDEHRVPVTAEFWAAWEEYLRRERGAPATDAAWVGLARGRGKPLNYQAFAAGLRYLGGKLGVEVSAHMFRHTVASRVTDTAGPHVAQELLAHRHIGTTVDTYAHVDHVALVRAVAGVEEQARAVSAHDARFTPRYAFAYDERTLAELDAVANPRIIAGEQA
jgi:integrase/recombinase XerD